MVPGLDTRYGCTHVSGERFGMLRVSTTEESGLLKASVETRWSRWFRSFLRYL